MKNHWLAALLCALFVIAATGCGNPGGQDKGRRRAGATQTGTNIPRWTDDSPRDTRAKQRKTSPKREKRQKPKRERQERPRPADEDVIIRGGFR